VVEKGLKRWEAAGKKIRTYVLKIHLVKNSKKKYFLI
jgi:hypothetical protein